MAREESQEQPQSPNLAGAYREQARELARRFAVLEGVVGVALVGGLTLGQADRYSDIDLTVYLRHDVLHIWLSGVAPLPEGESLYHGVRLDLSYRDYADEQSRHWSSAERWQAAAAEILYDPESLVAALFREKAAEPAAERPRVLLDALRTTEEILERIVPAWLYRGDAYAAHHALNLALRTLMQAIYLANDQSVPTDRWLVHLVGDLEWKPERWEERLAAVMTVTEPTTAEASRRRQLLTALLRECWARVAPEKSGEGVTPREAEQLRMLQEVADAGTMPLAELQRRFGPRALLQSPAFDLLSVERYGHAPQVVFNRERLDEILAGQLGNFLDYQQRILRHLAATR